MKKFNLFVWLSIKCLIVFFIKGEIEGVIKEQVFNNDKVYNITQLTSVAILKNAYIYPNDVGKIFNNKNRISLKDTELQYFPDPSINSTLKSKVIEKHKKLACVYNKSSTYFHFVAQVLPRIIFLKELLDIDPKLRVLFSSQFFDFIYEYLTLLRIDHNRILKSDKNKIYKSDLLYLPTPIRFLNKDALNITRNTFLEIINKNNQNLFKEKDLIIIVKRNKNSRKGRAISNHDELVKQIKIKFPKIRKKIVIFDGSIDIINQIELFSKAKIVIAPHGAGLVNTIFSPLKTHVIEFLPDEYQNGCFIALSQLMGLKHHKIVVCCGHDHKANFNVDVNEVCNILNKILNKFI